MVQVYQRTFSIRTRGNCDVLDITDKVELIVAASEARNGIVNVSAAMGCWPSGWISRFPRICV